MSRHIVLIGFMATGKTTVGRLAAGTLALPFVDLDEVIAAEQGMPVSGIFATRGEAAFRRAEADALTRVLAGPPSVIATGGGAACHEDNLSRMRASGLVIALTAPLEVVLARAGDPATRPLLHRPADEIRALYDRRTPIYRQAHAAVPTADTSPERVAAIIAELARRGAALPDDLVAGATLVPLGERTYPIIVTSGALERLGALARQALGPGATRLAVITDSHVGPLHGPAARDSLERAGFTVHEVTVAAGEPSKSFVELERLCEELAASGLDRGGAVVALGGGVVGDLAGFVAATLFRGIACIQVPTTIIAMVDSAIGGKTGINIAAGKNLVGAFWQPRLVLADPALLGTLPARERRAAFGELVKYALLDGEELYQAVDDLAPLIAPDHADAAVTADDRTAAVIRRSAAIKSFIVGQDEREQSGERALLNLGHTMGHAIEAAAGYGTVLHGEAVALGLIAACRMSARLGLCAAELEARVTATLRRAALDIDLDAWLRPEVVRRIGVDKKRTGSMIQFIAVRGVGVPARISMTLDELSRILLQ